MNGSIPNSEQDAAAACEQALQLAPQEWPSDLPLSDELGVPEWYPFEHAAWTLGESVRRAFVKHPQLKKRTALVSKVVKVATCQNLRRGRQAFIMALGFVAAQPHASVLSAYLLDPDVDGQVVYTLLKMRANGFSRDVSPLLNSKRAWVRQLARKYVSRYKS